ncbi:MAG: hypothetical protein AAF439_00255 [Pseudomonadota bacterium]
MKRQTSIIAATAATALIAGCIAPTGKHVVHPATAVGLTAAYVAVSPILILQGLAEGISSTPHFVDADLKMMNATLVKANAPVDLARTYRYAYAQDFDRVSRAGGGTRVFRKLRDATRSFQSALRGYGIPNATDYLLTAVRTADAQGYTLYAVVYRPENRIRVRTADGRVDVLTARDDAFYRPYEADASGRPLDLVLDWAAVPRTAIRTQKGQAIMMTIAANAVLINRRSDDFWGIDRRWRQGAFREITERRKALLDARLR